MILYHIVCILTSIFKQILIICLQNHNRIYIYTEAKTTLKFEFDKNIAFIIHPAHCLKFNSLIRGDIFIFFLLWNRQLPLNCYLLFHRLKKKKGNCDGRSVCFSRADHGYNFQNKEREKKRREEMIIKIMSMRRVWDEVGGGCAESG